MYTPLKNLPPLRADESALGLKPSLAFNPWVVLGFVAVLALVVYVITRKEEEPAPGKPRTAAPKQFTYQGPDTFQV